MVDPIRLDRVLLVVNSDNAQSISDADDYATRRNLTGGHTIAFAFGTLGGLHAFTFAELFTAGGPSCTTAPYIGQMYLTALGNYMTDHAIDAVILSTFTPCSFNPQFVGLTYTMASLAGYAKQIKVFKSVPAAFFDTPYYMGVPHNTVPEIQAGACQNWHPGSARNPFGAVPHGMLGTPRYDGNVIAERPLRASIGSESIYSHAVTQGLLAENIDHTSEDHLLSDNINVTINAQAANWARQLAMLSVRNAGNGYTWTPQNGGSISGNLNLFAICADIGFFTQDWVFGGALADSFTVRPGGWCWQYVSNGGFLASDFMYNGGSAGVFDFGEPLSLGIPVPQELFIVATTFQTPLMLAHFLAHGNGMGSTVCGDPLYAPYKSTDIQAPKAWAMPH